MTMATTETRFQLDLPEDPARRLRGVITLPDPVPAGGAPSVLVVHGFKGFLRWGFFPELQRRIATRGMAAVAFNLSGSGYGSATDELVSVERDGTGRVAIIDLVNGDVRDISATSSPEGVCYQDLGASFATLEDAGGPVTVAFHDEWFAPSGTTTTIAPTSNGVVTVSAAFASFLTRSSLSGEFLLTVTATAT